MKGMPPRCMNERSRNCLQAALAISKGIHTQFLHLAPHFLRWRVRRKLRPECNLHWIWNLAGKLPKKFAPREAEDRSPYAINIDRNNRRFHALHDALEPAPERQHLPDARHLAFRKNAKQLAVLERIGRRPQRMN